MLINNCGHIEAWHGIWPARKNSRKIVCVLEGSAHTGLEGAEYLGTHYSRSDGEYFDWYRLPRGVEIVKRLNHSHPEGEKK